MLYCLDPFFFSRKQRIKMKGQRKWFRLLLSMGFLFFKRMACFKWILVQELEDQLNKVIYYFNTFVSYLSLVIWSIYIKTVHRLINRSVRRRYIFMNEFFTRNEKILANLAWILCFISIKSNQILIYFGINWCPTYEIWYVCWLETLSEAFGTMFQLHLMIGTDMYRTSSLIWWLQKLKFVFVVLEFRQKSKWNSIDNVSKVCHKYSYTLVETQEARKRTSAFSIIISNSMFCKSLPQS